MTIQIDPVITKKLLLVKQLYHQAILQAKVRYSDVSRITSVVIFDLATETMLKTLALGLDPKKDPDKTFEALIQQTDDLMNKASLQALPHKTQIRHVHSIRNDAQHKARYPTDTEVNDCRTYTRDFLITACMQVWGMDFEKISMLDVIKHGEVKKLLMEAEIKFSNKDYAMALGYAKQGVEIALSKAQKAFLEPIPSSVGLVVADGASNDSNVKALKALQDISEISTLYVLGINQAEFIKYKMLNNCIRHAYFGGGKINVAITGAIPDVEEVEFAINYAIDTVAQIEGQVGDLDHPFGKQSFSNLGKRLWLRQPTT